MIDYHLHLWPHGDHERVPALEQIAAYVEAATAAGVREVALTEHLFCFRQADHLRHGIWEDDPNAALRRQKDDYWDQHCTADLDAYVRCVLDAKAAGLPVVLGLEVDHYVGSMDAVAELLDGYPFDVLLGSVHWLGAWLFDILDSDVAMREWTVRGVETAWRQYTDALEELAASGAVDVLAHPDLAKVAGHRPDRGLLDDLHERIAEAAASSGMAAEVSSAGWRKPAGEQYPAASLLDRFRAKGVPVTTASDGHRLDQVSWRVQDLRPVLEAAGYTSLHRFRHRKAEEVPL